ncbi:hypothetical protein H4R99_007487 [Coemansia sp. RSA 1722]|nr:hypothetical protein IWW45_005138 [Coemansia sp. RSA 485]KAJ2589359.1 hypothetical protein H4R99_007487 [Coemansia sp. RSA 1722]
MFNNQVNLGFQSPQVEHLSQSELSVIQQLRHLQQQRLQYNPAAGARIPLGMINHEGRRYLEIRQHYSPIMVPTHMVNMVRDFLANNLPQRLRAENNAQIQSPPQSPPYASSMYMSMSPPAMVPQSPPNTSGMNFQLGDGGSALGPPNLSLSMPPSSSISFTEPVPIPQMNSPSSLVASTSLSSAIPAASLPSALPSANLNLTSSPPNSSFMETDDMLQESADMEYPQARKKHKSRSPPTGGKVTKRSASTKSRKAQKGNRRNNAANGNASNGNGVVVKQEDGGNEDNEAEGCNDLAEECNDSDDADEPCDDGNDLESEEEELRKPANAFILYRQQRNLNLRAEKPGISVEAASAIIGKYWREESKEVKEKYHEMAMKARDQYFAKKKRIQARQKQKKIEREELAQMQHGSRNPQKTKRQASGPNFVSQLVVSDARELSSFAPEALAQGPLSAMSHQEFSALQMPQPRLSRALTVNVDSRFISSSLDDSVLGNNTALGMGNHSGLTPAMTRMGTGLGLGLGLDLASKNTSIDSYFADSRLSGLTASQDISQQVSSSMAELRNAFGTSQSQPSSSAMAVDQPNSVSSPPNSGSNTNGNFAENSTLGWGQTDDNDSSGFSSMLSSLFRKDA